MNRFERRFGMNSNIKKLLFIIGSAVFCLSALSAADVYDEIMTIESKKEELLHARNGDYGQEDEIRRRADEEFRIECEKIDEELLRIAETDSDGRILADVRKRRLEEKEKIRKEIYARAEAEIAALRNGDSGREKELLAQIRELQNQLKRKRVTSSDEDSKLLDVSTYAGDRFYWNARTRFYIGSEFIFTQTVNAEYQRITGKKPVSITQADEATYNDYLDTVDYYDEMLKSSKGSVVLEIEYSVEALPDDQPSCYRITIYDIRYVNAGTKDVLQRFTPENNSFLYKVQPALDIRSIESKYTGNKTVTAATQAESEYTGNKTVTPAEKSAITPADKSGRFLIGVYGGFIPEYIDLTNDTSLEMFGPCGKAFISMSITNSFFWQFDAGFIPVPTVFGNYTCEDGTVMNMMLSLGFYKQWKSFDFWCSCGAGIAGSDSLNDITAAPHQSFLFTGKVGVGADWHITDMICLDYAFDMLITDALGFIPCTQIGVSIDLN